MQPSILTTKQVAERFGVVPQTVISWANTGHLPHFRTPGGHRRFREADVEALRAASTAVIVAGDAA